MALEWTLGFVAVLAEDANSEKIPCLLEAVKKVRWASRKWVHCFHLKDIKGCVQCVKGVFEKCVIEKDIESFRKALLRKSCWIFEQTCFKERDEKIEELQAALQEAKQKLESLNTQQKDSGQGLRRSKRVATSGVLQQELADTKARLEQCQMELNTTTAGKAVVLCWFCTMPEQSLEKVRDFFTSCRYPETTVLSCRW